MTVSSVLMYVYLAAFVWFPVRHLEKPLPIGVCTEEPLRTDHERAGCLLPKSIIHTRRFGRLLNETDCTNNAYGNDCAANFTRSFHQILTFPLHRIPVVNMGHLNMWRKAIVYENCPTENP